MILILVLAPALFLLGLFSVDLVWIAAIVLVVGWLVVNVGPSHGLFGEPRCLQGHQRCT